MELGREMVIYDLETAPWLAWCYGNQYEPVVAKEDTHRMAESNKAFAHFAW
jgi:hypothetical protein